MYNITLIGAGQLGSRHLQSLAKMHMNLNIEVVEPNSKSAETALARFYEIPVNDFKKNIKFFSNTEELSKEIDVAIVATSSDVRAMVIKNLLKSKKVKNIILEKILFQKEKEYHEISNLLQEMKIKTWVNHPRRLFPFYEKVKKSLAGSKTVSYRVSGGDWGLACNGLHFIDHLSFLTNATVCTLSANFLSEEILNSKRPGYYEVSGNLLGKIGNHIFDLACLEAASPVLVDICSDKAHWIINENSGHYSYAEADSGWKWIHADEKIVYFQSELTHVLVTDILMNGNCGLPTYQNAMELHLPFIQSIMKHIEKNLDKKLGYCPIT